MSAATIAPTKPTGRDLRNQAMARHRADPVKAVYIDRAMAAVILHLANGPATIEECLKAQGIVRPVTVSHNAIGPIAATLSLHGLICKKGYRQARAVSRKSCVVALWELVE